MFIGPEKGRYTLGMMKGAGLVLCFGSNAGWVTNRESEKRSCRRHLAEGIKERETKRLAADTCLVKRARPINCWFDSGPMLLVCRPKWQLRLPTAVGLREHQQERTGSPSEPPPHSLSLSSLLSQLLLHFLTALPLPFLRFFRHCPAFSVPPFSPTSCSQTAGA